MDGRTALEEGDSGQGSAMTKWVYGFGGGQAEGRAEMKALLGGKGANLAEMSALGLPVPPGFTITTEVCTFFNESRGSIPRAWTRRSPRRWPRSRRSRRRLRESGQSRCWSRCARAPGPRCRA